MSNFRSTDIGHAALREVAVIAGVDPRTAAKFVRGGAVTPQRSVRIAAALRELGFAHLIPEAPDGAVHGA